MDVRDNFLCDDDFNELEKYIISDEFPLFPQNYITGDWENDKIENVNFTHTLYRDHAPVSNYFSYVYEKLFSQLDIKAILYAKVNCYPRNDRLIEHDLHTDYPYSHKGAILFLNTCDGYTTVIDEKVESIANRLLLFDPGEKHSSSSCTDQKCRLNIIINYF